MARAWVLLSLGLAAGLAASAPARADWRMTRWGMSSVRAAQAATKAGLAPAREAPAGQDGIAFDADDSVGHIAVRDRLLFGRDDKLFEVDVSPLDLADCDDFRTLAVIRYGAADELSVSDTQKVWFWRDKQTDVDVGFTLRYAATLDRHETACFIAYSKLTPAGRDGL